MKSKLFNDWSTLRKSDWSTQKGPNKSKNNKLPVATRFLGSFDGNGGVYYALFKKPAGDSEKKHLFTEPKPCKPETIRWQPWQNLSSRTHKYLDLAVVPGYCLVEQPGAQQIGTGNWVVGFWIFGRSNLSSQMWHGALHRCGDQLGGWARHGG